MAITKEIKDWLTITPEGVFEHRRVTRILEDGEFLAEKNHRTTWTPLANKADMPPKLRAIADIVWTQAIIDAYKLIDAPRPV